MYTRIPLHERQGMNMGRVERRMYANARLHAALCRLLAGLTVLVIAAGLLLRAGSQNSMKADAVPLPTATPVTKAFDESIVRREVTLEKNSWFALQTGIYSGKAAAEEHAQAYAARGAPGYVTQDGDKWRVLIACYGRREDAGSVREKLSAAGVETYLHTWDCPELTLRLSGMAGQIDVAESGLMLMLHTAAALRDGASMLDAGEYTAAEAAQRVRALDEQVKLWRETALARFVRPLPDMVDTLVSQTDAWQTRCKAMLQAAQDATALSASMKLQAMAIYDACCAMRRQILK